jgi:hypothetical protein
MTETKLYEVDHPYYCEEGNYYNNDCHFDYDSWGAFLQEWGDADLDMNLVIRWDWRDGEYETPAPDHKGMEYLYVYIVGQRKAKLQSCKVAVRREEEPEIRAWLLPRYERLLQNWYPLSDRIPPKKED